MKHIAPLALLGAFCFNGILALPGFASPDESVECSVVEENDKIIRCTYSSTRIPEARTVIFYWNSETTPQDDRERRFVMPAGHGSVYDYRYYYGRAQGLWQVRVADEAGTTLAETSFTLE